MRVGGGRGCDMTAGGWPVDPPDALVQILEDQEERDGRRAYTLAIVDGVLHVTPRMDPGVARSKSNASASVTRSRGMTIRRRFTRLRKKLPARLIGFSWIWCREFLCIVRFSRTPFLVSRWF